MSKEEKEARKQGVKTGWAKQNNMCSGGYEWWQTHSSITDADLNILKLMDEKKYEWCCWFVMKMLPQEDQIALTLFAFEKVVNTVAPLDGELLAAINAARAIFKKEQSKDKQEVQELLQSLKTKEISRIHAAAIMLIDICSEYDETACQRVALGGFGKLSTEDQIAVAEYCIKLYRE